MSIQISRLRYALAWLREMWQRVPTRRHKRQAIIRRRIGVWQR